MQNYWTLLKLICLAAGLTGLVYAQRGPAYVSLWLIGDDDGKVIAVEIDGDRIDADGPRVSLLKERFRLALASRGSQQNPWIQIRVDDNIPWREAKGAFRLAFDIEREPKISLVREFSAAPRPGEQIVIHKPDQDSSNLNVTLSVRSTTPGHSEFYLGQQSLNADQLNQAIRKLIGEPGSDKARQMRAVISIQNGVPFQSVREALEAVSGGETVITGEWQPYIELFLIDGMEWSGSPNNTRFERIKDALSQATP